MIGHYPGGRDQFAELRVQTETGLCVKNLLLLANTHQTKGIQKIIQRAIFANAIHMSLLEAVRSYKHVFTLKLPCRLLQHTHTYILHRMKPWFTTHSHTCVKAHACVMLPHAVIKLCFVCSFPTSQ